MPVTTRSQSKSLFESKCDTEKILYKGFLIMPQAQEHIKETIDELLDFRLGKGDVDPHVASSYETIKHFNILKTCHILDLYSRLPWDENFLCAALVHLYKQVVIKPMQIDDLTARKKYLTSITFPIFKRYRNIPCNKADLKKFHMCIDKRLVEFVINDGFEPAFELLRDIHPEFFTDECQIILKEKA